MADKWVFVRVLTQVTQLFVPRTMAYTPLRRVALYLPGNTLGAVPLVSMASVVQL